MATPRWRGNAANITQVDTITVANTWAEDDTATITINGNDIVCTVGSSDTTGDVAALISAAINASASSASATAGDYNIGGQEIPEFTEVVATVAGSVVTVTANTAGKPFTMSVAETTAGDGVATEATATAATGKHFWSNADNWSTGSVPANGDDVWFDSGDVDCKYGLPSGSLQPNSVSFTMDYTGKVGLPEINKDSGNSETYYREYRSTYVTLDDDATDSFVTIVSGNGGTGAGSPMVNIAWSGTTTVTVECYDTGTPQSGVSSHALNIKGSPTAFSVDIRKGSVAFAPKPGDTTVISSITIGYASQQSTDANVYIGDDATLSTGIASYGGHFECRGLFSSGIVTMYAGTGLLQVTGSGDLTTLSVFAPAVLDLIDTGTVTNLALSGTLRNSGPSGAVFTNAVVTRGATITDPSGLLNFTNGLDLTQCGVEDCTLNMGQHFTFTKSAI